MGKKKGMKSKWFNVKTWGSWRMAFVLARLQQEVWARRNGETYTGTVKAFNTSKGFGFLSVANHPADVCLHKDLVPPQLMNSNIEGRQLRATVMLSADGKARAATLSA